MSTKEILPNNTFRKPTKIDFWDKLYLFMAMLYMGQAGFGMQAMVYWKYDTKEIFFFILPILFTLIVSIRKNIKYDKQFFYVVGLFSLWTFFQFIKYESLNASYTFFTFYPIWVAYVMIKAYKKYLFVFYEKILVVLSLISIFFWMIQLAVPSVFTDGFNIYLYTALPESLWSSPIRNAGFSWEPGRFAAFIVIALFFNASRNKFAIKKLDKNFLILLLVLVTTFSTTGYAVFFLVIAALLILNSREWRVPLLIITIFSVFYLYTNLNFLGEKVSNLSNYQATYDQIENSVDYAGDDYKTSLQRFDATIFEGMNLEHDIWLGYGKNRINSYVSQNFSELISLPNGHLRVLAQHGIFLGLLIFYFLYLSSKTISNLYGNTYNLSFMYIILLICFSYSWFSVPYITAFWLYGVFEYKTIYSIRK